MAEALERCLDFPQKLPFVTEVAQALHCHSEDAFGVSHAFSPLAEGHQGNPPRRRCEVVEEEVRFQCGH